MIEGIQGIIGQIRYFDQNNLNKSFSQVGDSESVARVLIFGEEHTDIVSQIETLGAINALASPGDTILLEGGDRKSSIESNCAYYLLLNLYVNWQWEKLGEPYNVANVQVKLEWQKQQQFDKAFIATRNSYNIADLSIARVHCGFWDDETAIKETFSKNDVTRDTLLKRNESMAEAIKTALDRGSGRALINTGYRHMPSYDLFYTRIINKDKNQSFPQELRRYYELVKETRSKPENERVWKLDSSAGTTEPIYKYLVNNNIPFREYIHRRLAAR